MNRLMDWLKSNITMNIVLACVGAIGMLMGWFTPNLIYPEIARGASIIVLFGIIQALTYNTMYERLQKVIRKEAYES